MTSLKSPPVCAIVWRGDAGAAIPHRLVPIHDALVLHGAVVSALPFAEERADAFAQELAACDGALVWVDPLSDGRNRAVLEPILRDAARNGAWISAHPDVVLKMGVKEVLHRTQSIGWCHGVELHQSWSEFSSRFPGILNRSGPRVLKQNRGNGGQGIWKVEAAAAIGGEPAVKVLHALRGSIEETLPLEAFMQRCAPYFLDGGKIIDQPFEPRLPEGMIRCYMAHNEVVGYGRQLIKALASPPPEGPESPQAQPGPRIMHPPGAPAFARLRALMERTWVPAMMALLDIRAHDLPALWDADFLLGAKTPEGEDAYVLCEINASCVSPFPDDAPVKVAQAAIRGMSGRAARRMADAG
ncbi:MAG: Cj0069 family protein [Alphaproteobacteria bacterium]|nr:Cj0069 family protein [Alphaproteobacteria bacterium]